MISIANNPFSVVEKHGAPSVNVFIEDNDARGVVVVKKTNKYGDSFHIHTHFNARLYFNDAGTLLTKATITHLTADSATIVQGNDDPREIGYLLSFGETVFVEVLIINEIIKAAKEQGLGTTISSAQFDIKETGGWSLISGDGRISLSIDSDAAKEYIHYPSENGVEGLVLAIIDGAVAASVKFTARYRLLETPSFYSDGEISVLACRKINQFTFKEFELIELTKVSQSITELNYLVSETDTTTIKALIEKMAGLYMNRKSLHATAA